MKRAVVCLAILLLPGSVHASKTYPPRIQSELGLAEEPPCTVCHTNDDGGKNTVTKPFGRSLMDLGLKGVQPAALAPLLEKSRDAGIDSDHDGVGDVEELEEGTDPNVPDVTSGSEDGGSGPRMICTPELPPELTTGCAVRAPARRLSGAFPLLAAVHALRPSAPEVETLARAPSKGERLMNRMSSCLAALAVLAAASTSSAGDPFRASSSSVKFHAVGPAGLAIDGDAPEMTLSDADGKLVFEVPAGKFATGISLRDKHLKKYLNAEKHPKAKLVVEKSKIKMPESGDVNADADGEFTLNNVTHPVKVHYTLKRKDKGYEATGAFSINIEDHSIKQPCYLGVCVDTKVKIDASITTKGE